MSDAAVEALAEVLSAVNADANCGYDRDARVILDHIAATLRADTEEGQVLRARFGLRLHQERTSTGREYLE